jgi:hypothetical protein
MSVAIGASLGTVEPSSITNLLICLILGASGRLRSSALVEIRQGFFENAYSSLAEIRLLQRAGAPWGCLADHSSRSRP